MSDSIDNGGHMVGPSAGAEADTPILPSLEELFGNDAQLGSGSGFSEQELDDMFNQMFDVAVDPNTEMPEGDLIPDLDSFPAEDASDEVDLTDLDGSSSTLDDATSVDDLPSEASGSNPDTGDELPDDLTAGTEGQEPLDDSAVTDDLEDLNDLGDGLDSDLDDAYSDHYGDDHPDDLTDLSGM